MSYSSFAYLTLTFLSVLGRSWWFEAGISDWPRDTSCCCCCCSRRACSIRQGSSFYTGILSFVSVIYRNFLSLCFNQMWLYPFHWILHCWGLEPHYIFAVCVTILVSSICPTCLLTEMIRYIALSVCLGRLSFISLGKSTGCKVAP